MSAQKPITSGLPVVGDRDSKQPTNNSAVSQRKLEANRANSLKSTGPKTARGKNVASFNALKHGGYMRELFILQGKHLTEYETFRQLSDELQSQMSAGAYLEERVMIQNFVMAAWRMERLYRLDLTVDVNGGAAAVPEFFPATSRHFAHAVRDLENAYDRLQELRHRVEQVEPAEAEVEAAETAADPQGAVQLATTAAPNGVRTTNVSRYPDAGTSTSDISDDQLHKRPASAVVSENGNRNKMH